MQTQVLPYLRLLAADGNDVYLMTFEPQLKTAWDQAELDDEKKRLYEVGITWFCLPYHKWPSVPATLYDIAKGALLARRLARTHGIDVFHARTHVPALMGAIAKWMCGGRLLFDIRGFMPEEYTDAGVWPENGLIYRQVKRVERVLFRASDAFVVLTEKARDILFPGRRDANWQERPIEVIPCCVDFERFRQAEAVSKDALRQQLKLTDRRVIVYVGSLGTWYMMAEMTEFLALAHARDPRTFALILTQSPQEPIRQRLRDLGLGDADFLVDQVPHQDVPRYLRAADFAISFIKACYSKQSSSPTKIAEYLASGLPIVCNAGVGDLDQLIEGEHVGVLVRGFSPDDYAHALEAVERLILHDPPLADHCRAVAIKHFDLKRVGGVKYCRLYRNLSALGRHHV